MSVNPCRGEIQSMRRCRSESSCATGSHFFEITFPATSPQIAGLVKAERFRCNCAQREIDCVTLCLQAVAPHDRQAGFFIDVNVRACHVPSIHIIGAFAMSRSGALTGWVRRAPVLCPFLDPEPKDTMAWGCKPSKSRAKPDLAWSEGMKPVRAENYFTRN